MSLELRKVFSKEFSMLGNICGFFVIVFTKSLYKEDAFEIYGESGKKNQNSVSQFKVYNCFRSPIVLLASTLWFR